MSFLNWAYNLQSGMTPDFIAPQLERISQAVYGVTGCWFHPIVWLEIPILVPVVIVLWPSFYRIIRRWRLSLSQRVSLRR